MLRTLPARLLLSSALTLVLVAITTAPAQAAIIDLDLSEDVPVTHNDTEGSARGIYFEATSSFSITSVGIFARLQNKPLTSPSQVKEMDVLIYSVTDGVADQVLASAINQTPEFDANETADRWNDIAINYSFQAATEYIVLWRPNEVTDQWVNTTRDLKLFGFSSLAPDEVSVLPLLTVLRGRSGREAQDITHPVAHFRFNAIPEPASLAMLGLMGTAIMLRRRRR